MSTVNRRQRNLECARVTRSWHSLLDIKATEALSTSHLCDNNRSRALTPQKKTIDALPTPKSGLEFGQLDLDLINLVSND
jgi:hypothetical protein